MSQPHPASEPTLSTFSHEVAQQRFAIVRAEMAKAVIWQAAIVEQLLLTLLCREHALLVGPPGSGKWRAVRTLGACFGLTCRRLRSSPDLSANDLSGTEALYQAWQTSLLLADDFDCLAPKVRHLIHQAMCERTIEKGNEQIQVPDPFVVFATRAHPDESASHALPASEPGDDRFLFQITIPYPAYQEEFSLATTRNGMANREVQQVVSLSELNAWRSLVLAVEAPPSVVHYAVRLVRATRVHEGENPDFIYEWVQRGAGPRAALFLILGAKARATLFGRSTASDADVRALAEPVLRHRISTNRNARANGIDADRVIHRLLEEVPARIAGDDSIPASGAGFTFHDWVPFDDADP